MGVKRRRRKKGFSCMQHKHSSGCELWRGGWVGGWVGGWDREEVGVEEEEEGGLLLRAAPGFQGW